MNMQGNTILVAGGARGIGRGVAGLLLRLGNEVLVFDAEPGAAQAAAQACPGLQAVELALADPWSVAAFAEQVAARCPGLNLLLDIAIAFPVTQLPGLRALLDDDTAAHRAQAHRLGMQHLAGALMPHLRKRTHSAVMTLSVGPAAQPRTGGLAAWAAASGGLHASALSVRKGWARACIEVIDVARPSRAERLSAEAAARPDAVPRTQFVTSLAHLLAEGLHETAALARLQALWAAPRPAPRRLRDDGLLSEVH
ncbi:SDR family NAD(P)-dependent oxidoreductase [Roseateles sp. DXS20W]|uniref:SDR family NAD(P)-dependent oxidoreductase n=1 Tax=Pelomonas lactea TaxID=3299030 RepID=A0ABW7GE40_9BURK